MGFCKFESLNFYTNCDLFFDFFVEKNVHEALSFCIVNRIMGIGCMGVWVLGVRLRMRGVFTTRNSHFGAVRVRGCP